VKVPPTVDEKPAGLIARAISERLKSLARVNEILKDSELSERTHLSSDERPRRGGASTLRGNILLVANTNVLFSFFGKPAITGELIFLLSGRIISPEFALEELREHKDGVIRTAKISEGELSEIINVLREHVIFVEEDFYAEFIPLAIEITPDKDDAGLCGPCPEGERAPVEQRQEVKGNSGDRSAEHWGTS